MLADATVKPLRANEWALLKIVKRYGTPWVEVDTFKLHFGSTRPLIADLLSKGLIEERPASHRVEHALRLTTSGGMWYEWQRELDT